MGTSRITAIGFIAALALTACGQASEEGAGSLLQPPRPVRVVNAGAAAEGRLSSDAAISAMPAFVGFTYVAGPDLPALPTNSTGYQYAPGATVDAARVAELAAALGVEGEPVPGGGAQVDGLAWRVGPDDGSAPTMTVGADPQLNVNYSQAWSGSVSVGCAVAVGGTPAAGGAATDVATDVAPGAPMTAADGGTTSDSATAPAKPVEPPATCLEPKPPANVPTADEAEALAGDALEAIGLDPATFEFETYADDWAASVTAWSRLDGVRSPIAWGFGFGENAELQWMNGTLATPVATGPYPLIGLDEALKRLGEQNGWVGRGGIYMEDAVGAPDPATSGAAESPVEVTAPTESSPQQGETMPPDTLPVVEPTPSGSNPVGSIPVDSVPVELPTEVATLVDVRADLWWAWGDDGSVWLLPAYTFTDTEGRVFTVPAVTDEFLVMGDPVVGEPMPLDPKPLDPMPVEPLPGESPAPDSSAIIGLAIDDATKTLEGQGLTLRVVIKDGEALAVTDDFSTSRVNVEVADGVVVGVVSVG